MLKSCGILCSDISISFIMSLMISLANFLRFCLSVHNTYVQPWLWGNVFRKIFVFFSRNFVFPRNFRIFCERTKCENEAKWSRKKKFPIIRIQSLYWMNLRIWVHRIPLPRPEAGDCSSVRMVLGLYSQVSVINSINKKCYCIKPPDKTFY